MSAININLVFKRKDGSRGAISAPYETLRTVAMRKLHERHVTNDAFPQGANVQEWEWLIVGDEKQFRVIWDIEFQDMLQHYEAIGG